MMFSTLFVLFAVAAAANADVRDNDDCKSRVWHKCDVSKSPDLLKTDTMEELKKGCIVVQEFAKCISEGIEKCDLDGIDGQYERFLGRLAHFLETNCDEESSLYQALSRNYKCIQPIRKTLRDQCYWINQDLEEMENLKKKADIRLSDRARRCDNDFYEITCTAHIFGTRCGQEAKEVVTEIMQNIDFFFRDCNDESIIRELEPLRELYESTFDEEPEVEDNNILEVLSEALDK